MMTEVLQVDQQMALEQYKHHRAEPSSHLVLSPVNVQVLGEAHGDCQRGVHIVLSGETSE